MRKEIQHEKDSDCYALRPDGRLDVRFLLRRRLRFLHPASSGSSGSSETSVSASESASAEESASESSSEELSGERLNDILDAGVITLVTSPDFAPLEFEDISSGETVYAGSDIELAKYIADYLGVELEIQAMDFQACQAAIATGQADMMISGCAPTEERRRTMELSDPYNTSSDDGQLLIVPLDMVSTYNSAESFAGKTIACQNGSLQYNLTSEQLPDAEIQIIGSLGDGVLMVDNGRVDAMACSGDTAKMYVENYPDLGSPNGSLTTPAKATSSSARRARPR